MATKNSVLTSVTTRFSKRSDNVVLVVFDVAGTKHYLSEIFMPGEDGFQVPCAPGPHTHEMIKASK